MDKRTEVGLLYEFYFKLLTNKQSEIFKLYYFDDFSLNEIASIFDLTKQGISDNLNRTVEKLYNFENELNLSKKYFTKKENIKKINEVFNEFINQNDIDKQFQEQIIVIKDKVIGILNDIDEEN